MFYAKRVTLKDKKLVNDVDYDGIKFPVNKEDFNKTEKKNNIRINVFGYENKLTLPIYISDQKFGNSMDLLLVINENKLHYVHIKGFERFASQNKKTIKNTFTKVVCTVLVVKMYWQNKKKFVQALMNGAQPVTFEKETTEFKNYFKQIPAPFKVYAYFKCNLKSVESQEGPFSKNIKLTFIVVLLTNLFVLMINLVSQLLNLEVKMLLLNFSKQFLESMNTVKK